jgi:hypothetical protein
MAILSVAEKIGVRRPKMESFLAYSNQTKGFQAKRLISSITKAMRKVGIKMDKPRPAKKGNFGL